MITFNLDIVSQTKMLFTGSVKSVVVDAAYGQIGIRYGHAPLLTKLKPGTVNFFDKNDKEHSFYLSGGILEIQPYITTILADDACNVSALNEKSILEAKAKAEKLMQSGSDFNEKKVKEEINEAIAKLRIIRSHSNKNF
jgi:F-type H+-transporting ATPase subunit epsilon